MRAYIYDDIPGDQRLAHDSGEALPESTLAKLGVLYRHFPLDGTEEAQIAKIKSERGYRHSDSIDVTKAGLGDQYEAKLKMFFEEHMHEDEEIRYITAGSGFFDVRDRSDARWIRVHVTPGDLLMVPSGIYHRFTLDEGDAISALRLFKDEPKWTAYNRSAETDANPVRLEYVQSRE